MLLYPEGVYMNRQAAPGDRASTAPDHVLSPAAEPFGANLEPFIRRACNDRLSQIVWFRTDWQRGGAATGFATYRADDDRSCDVVVKLPVPPVERMWLDRLQPFDGLVPRLHAHGLSLNGYDMAWVVMERLPHGPMGATWGGRQFDLFVEAAGRFYAAGDGFEVDGPAPQRGWEAAVKRARDAVQHRIAAHGQRWKQALKKAGRELDSWLEQWESRCTDHWCHGDFHLANAMTRMPPPDGPAVLIDFARVRPGHWVEDAVYFEHLYWGRAELLEGRKLCRLIARQRKAHGLTVDDDWPRLAQIQRVLLAATAPAAQDLYADERQLDAMLETLERALK